jgi:hypothetical protein
MALQGLRVVLCVPGVPDVPLGAIEPLEETEDGGSEGVVGRVDVTVRKGAARGGDFPHV